MFDLPLRRLIPILLVVVVGTIAAVSTFVIITALEDERHRVVFDRAAASRISAVRRHIESNLDVLRSIVDLYNSSEFVNRKEFRSFVSPALNRHDGIQALEWVPRVSNAARSEFEQAARDEGFSDFRLTERQTQGQMVDAAPRDEYFPVYYVEPFKGNEAAFGFDLASNERRLAAMNAARDDGRLRVSGRLTLVQEAGEQFGVLVFCPVYRRGVTVSTIAERRRHLIGFALAVIRIGDVITHALARSMVPGIADYGDVDLYVYDSDATPERQHLFVADARGRTETAPLLDEARARSDRHYAETFPIGGRRWTIVARPLDSLGDFRWGAWTGLAVALSFTAMIAGYLILTLSRERAVQRVVIERTAQLQRANDGLRETKERYSDLVEGSVQGILIDRDGVPLFVNKAYAEIFGYDNPHQLLNLDSLDRLYAPEEIERIREFRARRRHDEETPDTYSFEGVRKDGSQIWVESRAQAITWIGETATLSAIIDVTERMRAEERLRESEERFRALIEGSIQGMHVLKPWKSLFVNQAFVNLMGYDDASEILGLETPLLLYAPEEREMLRQLGLDRTAGHEVQDVYEVRGLRKDGSVIWLENRVTVVNWKGETAIQATAVDISERKQIERIKAEFVSTVSHELRTPLTSIKGSLGLIRGGAVGELPKRLDNLLDIAYKNSDRLVRLINDILDVEKIEADGMEFDMRPVDVKLLIEQAMEANRLYGDQCDVTFVVEGAVPEISVVGDLDRLMQVMANLLSNAAKFSPPGGKVEIIVTEQDSSVRVSVVDRGPGLAESFRERVFEKFSQADSSDSRQKGGTGLGLNISRAIVERHGGTIAFDTEVDVGTTFYFDLPVVRPGATGYDRRPIDGTKPRVLICEDEPDIISLLDLMLSNGGYATDIARNSKEAKAKLATNDYEAMTLDIGLPDQDGISLIRDVRGVEKTRDLPIVVVSAKTSDVPDHVKGDAIGIIDWLEKPIDQIDLMDSIRRAIRFGHADVPCILHVEDDADVRHVVAAVVGDRARIVPAASFHEAKECLNNGGIDVVVLDLSLPDGAGEDLLPLLRQDGNGSIPVIVFSAREFSAGTADNVEAALIKARTSNEALLEAILSAIHGRQGMVRPTA